MTDDPNAGGSGDASQATVSKFYIVFRSGDNEKTVAVSNEDFENVTTGDTLPILENNGNKFVYSDSDGYTAYYDKATTYTVGDDGHVAKLDQ